MKNIHHILLFALLLSAAPALVYAQCNNYTCKMELARKALKKGEYKSALDHARGAESYDASKKATVNLFIDEVFAAIEQKKKDAEDGEKKVKMALKEAEAAKRKATAVLDKIYFYQDRFGLAYDKNKERYGFIDKNLTTKIDFKYNAALPFDESGFAKVNNRRGYFFIDTLGNEYRLATNLNQLSPEITALDLRGEGLTEIPDTVLKSVQLKVLLLSSNQLSGLPVEIGELKNLQKIELYRNNLKDMPVLILRNLTNLKTIVLACKYGTNPLPETTVAALRAAMPWCEIEFDPKVFLNENQSKIEMLEFLVTISGARLKRTPNDTTFQKELASVYSSLGWSQLLTKQFSEAEASINKGFALDSINVSLQTNLAPALLLQGKTTEAIQEYTKWKDLPYGQNGQPFYRNVFLSDLNELESAGVIPEARKADVEAVRALLRGE